MHLICFHRSCNCFIILLFFSFCSECNLSSTFHALWCPPNGRSSLITMRSMLLNQLDWYFQLFWQQCNCSLTSLVKSVISQPHMVSKVLYVTCLVEPTYIVYSFCAPTGNDSKFKVCGKSFCDSSRGQNANSISTSPAKSCVDSASV